MKEYSFKAIIKQGSRGGAFVEFPYSVEEEFGVKGRVKVKATFEGVDYQGSLVKMGTDCHILIVLKAIREALDKKVGDKLKVTVIQDLTIREVEVHPTLENEFKADSTLKANYEKLSFTNKKEINKSLFDAKRESTKQNRLEKIILRLRYV